MSSKVLKVPIYGIISQCRALHGAIIPQIDMASLLRTTINAVDAKKKQNLQKEEERKAKAAKHTLNTIKHKESTLNTEYLNKKYRNKFKVPLSSGAIAEINGFFNNTEARLEWTSFKFTDIPGERERIEEEKQLLKQTEEDLAKDIKEVKVTNPVVNRLVGLPEILFIGKANVGKSTLLNSLLTESYLKKNKEFAFASKTAGFTPSMNCFNIGKRFRLIDTPGYGIRGTPQQGKQVLEYLRRRKELRRVYLLISAAEGFSEDDDNIIDFLTQVGVPFEIVFTKVDRLKNTKVVDKILKESGVLKIPSEPSLIFTNSETNKKFPNRRGLSDLRASIFEACDLKPGIHPLKLIKK